MPISRKELLDALKDPAIAQFLRAQAIQQASVTGIGRYPGQGPAQNDNYVYPDAADANFPYNFDYEIPGNFQRIISAKLSFKIRPYRTYSSLTVNNTGAGTAHSHNHGHGLTVSGNAQSPAGVAFGLDAGNNYTAANDANTTIHTAGAYGPGTNADATTEATHTHPLSATTTLGISEDGAPVNPGITVKVDGTDVTAAIGGPFNSDQVEVDVTQVLKTSAKVWHTMSLQPNQRVRLTGILRISYLVDSRLAQ